MSEPTSRGEMPFLDHLEELRWRLLYALGAIVIGTVAGWFIVQHVDILEVLKRPIAPFLPDGRLVFTSPAEPFLLTLKIAFAVGLVLASPVVVYQLWAFLAPALYQRERRIIVPALIVGVMLFGLGAFAAYSYALPAALRVLFDFQRADLAPVITIDRYFGFAIPFIMAFGAITELPLVITILAALGVVTPQQLSRHRRWAVMIGAIAAALLSPPDALSMIMMLVPILLLYEVSIWCAWVAARRRARRLAASSAPLVLLAFVALAVPARAQQVPAPRAPARDTTRAQGPGAPRAGQPVDTARARLLGLPTGPSRSFPAADKVLDSLLQLSGYQTTRYVAETLKVEGDSQTIHLRGRAFVERGETQLESDSIRFQEASCRLDAAGNPKLFDKGSVMVGQGMRYDTCTSRGVVTDALTDFNQGGVTWYMRGDLAIDSSSTRMYGASSEITSCDLPDPSYHFAANEVKWLNKNIMVVRPAVLYVKDVPVMWLPFLWDDIRPGRRSGLLRPLFGLNDIVRTSRSYERHFSNLGYYFAFNNYTDLEIAGAWYDERYVAISAKGRYSWLARFMDGQLFYRYGDEFGSGEVAHEIRWAHQQRFDSRTSLSADINYATNTSTISRNVIDPAATVAQLTSRANFSRRFTWGQFSIGGTRSQNLANELVTQTFPTINLAPAPVNLWPEVTWSPSFAFVRSATLHSGPRLMPIPGGAVPDTAVTFFDSHSTTLTFGTPLRIGRWNWSNSFSAIDATTTEPLELVDSTGIRTMYGRRFETRLDWQTGINLPNLFSSTWKLQPSVSIVNTTSAGPFMVRNQYTGGQWLAQGKRLQFGASISPTFFGFFPGFGPLARIRHAFSPSVSYAYAPAATVNEEFVRAIDPTGRTLNARTDPIQTISFGLNQTFEAKLKPPAGDSVGRKIRLLSINTSAVGYNFEVAKQPGRIGWQAPTLNNLISSQLLPVDISLTHDLWDGPDGTDSARFDPVLTGVTASFTLTPRTFRGLGVLLGILPARAEPPPAPPSGVRDTTGQVLPGLPPLRDPRHAPPIAGGLAAGGGRGFSVGVAYSSTTQRENPKPAPGNRTVTLTMAFQPTSKWSATWVTGYDFATERFGYHRVNLTRDLRRWQATFGFSKAPQGNFAFNFGISLLDEPDIKFDYDQQSYIP